MCSFGSWIDGCLLAFAFAHYKIGGSIINNIISIDKDTSKIFDKYAKNRESENIKSYGMFEEYPDVLSIKDLQNILGIGRTMAYRLINNGDIKHIRIGSSIKIPKQYIMDYVTQSCYNSSVATDNFVLSGKEPRRHGNDSNLM